MNRVTHTLHYLGIAVLASCAAAAAHVDSRASVDAALVREQASVAVAGGQEQWRLEWASKPSPVCAPDGDDWYTCPCTGFEFGEAGDLNLVRAKNGADVERFPLAPLFDGDFDFPASP